MDRIEFDRPVTAIDVSLSFDPMEKDEEAFIVGSVLKILPVYQADEKPGQGGLEEPDKPAGVRYVFANHNLLAHA